MTTTMNFHELADSIKRDLEELHAMHCDIKEILRLHRESMARIDEEFHLSGTSSDR